jgi:hypothetical protein
LLTARRSQDSFISTLLAARSVNDTKQLKIKTRGNPVFYLKIEFVYSVTEIDAEVHGLLRQRLK